MYYPVQSSAYVQSCTYLKSCTYVQSCTYCHKYIFFVELPIAEIYCFGFYFEMSSLFIATANVDYPVNFHTFDSLRYTPITIYSVSMRYAPLRALNLLQFLHRV